MASSLSDRKEISGDTSNSEELSSELSESKWSNLFSPEELPKSWIITKDPDGGWDYKEGVFIMKCLFDDSVALHDAPEGDVVVRLKGKIEDNENKENRFRRINVRKIVSLEDIVKANYEDVYIEVDTADNLKKLYESIKEKGNSKIKISIVKEDKKYLFELKDKRKFDYETLKYLNREPYIKKISV